MEALLADSEMDELCLKTEGEQALLVHPCIRELLNNQGYSGADVACLCREAALGPIRSIGAADITRISADQVGFSCGVLWAMHWRGCFIRCVPFVMGILRRL